MGGPRPVERRARPTWSRHTLNRVHRWFYGSAHWARVMQDDVVPWALQGVTLGERVLEIGPGSGHSTIELADRAPSVTAVEIDPRLAAATSSRLADLANVTVEQGDGTALRFADATFDAVVCFTVLHQLASPAAQDALLAEARRVLRPGGAFGGSDWKATRLFRLAHLGVATAPVDPDALAARLQRAVFEDINVRDDVETFRWRCRRTDPAPLAARS